MKKKIRFWLQYYLYYGAWDSLGKAQSVLHSQWIKKVFVSADFLFFDPSWKNIYFHFSLQYYMARGTKNKLSRDSTLIEFLFWVQYYFCSTKNIFSFLSTVLLWCTWNLEKKNAMETRPSLKKKFVSGYATSILLKPIQEQGAVFCVVEGFTLGWLILFDVWQIIALLWWIMK